MNEQEERGPQDPQTNLSDEELQEFIDLWREEFDETLTLEEAEAIARQLLELYWRLSQEPRQEDEKSS